MLKKQLIHPLIKEEKQEFKKRKLREKNPGLLELNKK
jgi:hypothetical protein